MARPLKEGLDYFSLDCYMDSKIKLIQAEYGLKGFAIVVKLWQMIYREHGYYSEWNDEKALLFAYEECSDCGVKLLNEIVETCFRRDIFSEKLFRKYRILTSSGIQKRYFLAVDRRRKNESKVNESRVESARTGLQSAPELYAALCSKYGRTFVDERVERSKQYKGANMQTVAKWCEEDFGKKPARKRNGFCNFQERDNDYAEVQKQLFQKSIIIKSENEETNERFNNF